MALGGEVDDRLDAVLAQQRRDHLAVADVGAHEDVAAIALQVAQVLQVAGVGEGVDVDQQVVGPAPAHQPRETGADEAGPAGDSFYETYSCALAPKLAPAGSRSRKLAAARVRKSFSGGH